MNHTYYIAINIMRRNPGEAEGWMHRFAMWIHTWLTDSVVAEKFEHGSNVLRRRTQLGRRTKITKKPGSSSLASFRPIQIGIAMDAVCSREHWRFHTKCGSGQVSILKRDMCPSP